MKREPVKSSSILSLGYEKETETLEIEFTSKAVYQFHGVPPDVWEKFTKAESKGHFFAVHVRACYNMTVIYRPVKEKKHGTQDKKATETKPAA